MLAPDARRSFASANVAMLGANRQPRRSLPPARAVKMPCSPDGDAPADRAIEYLSGPFDPLGGGVQRIGDRGLRRLGAVGGGGPHIPQFAKLLLQAANASAGIDQFVAHGERRHHGQARIADFAELPAQRFDPLLQIFGELEQPDFLSLFAGHPVLPAIDGDVDVVHSSSPASSASTACSALSASATPSTSRMVPMAASSRSAISRLARSSLRDFTSEVSSSSASRERSAPRAWMRVASSSSSRSASRRRSTALSSASSAVISRRVAASISAGDGSRDGKFAGRSFMPAIPNAARAAKPALRQALK